MIIHVLLKISPHFIIITIFIIIGNIIIIITITMKSIGLVDASFGQNGQSNWLTKHNLANDSIPAVITTFAARTDV